MRRYDAILPYLLLAPGLFLAAMIILMPLWQLSVLSFSDVNRFGVPRGLTGWDNYARIFADPDFYRAFWRTVVWTVGIVGGTILVAFPVALILNEDFAGRGVARVIVMLPWAMSLTMMAIVWRWALSGESGMLNSALIWAGVIERNVQWLAHGQTAFPMQIMIGILVSVPFTVTIFLGGLASIPDDLYEAARLESASAWQCFAELTWPLMRPFVNIAVVLNTIYVFNSFPIIWVTTQGGPANSTDILVTYLYRLGFRIGRMGEAAALSLLMFLFLLALTAVYVALATRKGRA
ncbi:MAG: sugar ABC transporter permease [Rubellimicrobium sp.]|nr:sugar ABC transporter permease [Rubellimicrobium sp.]